MSSSPLSPHLHEILIRYKKNTGTAIEWLAGHQKDGTKSVFDSTVREIKIIADDIAQRGIEMPQGVLYKLRDAIEGRTQISNYFEKLSDNIEQRISTDSHNHFKNTLMDIYEIFYRPSEACRTSVQKLQSEIEAKPQNKFEILAAIYPEENLATGVTDSIKAKSSNDVDSAEVEENSNGDASPDDHFIRDDYMARLMELVIILQELDKLIAVVKQSWKEAALGVIPSVVAACSSDTAYGAASVIISSLHKQNISNPDTFRETYRRYMQDLGIQELTLPDSSTIPSYTHMTMEIGPRLGWEVLLLFKQVWKPDDEVTSSIGSAIQDPRKFCVSAEDGEKWDRKYLEQVLQNMGHHLKYQPFGLPKGLQSYPPYFTPLLNELEVYLKTEDSCILSFQLSFGLHMLLECSKSFSTISDKSGIEGLVRGGQCIMLKVPTSKNGRTEALRLALDIERETELVLEMPEAPCSCHIIGGWNVGQLLHDSYIRLSLFIATRCYDLFYQNPWVSGTHMTSILGNACEVGGMAWHHAHFVGTLLHTYNTLVKLKELDPEQLPVLERLCNIWEKEVFFGQRPSSNFAITYQTWKGARLVFSTSPHRHQPGIISRELNDKSQKPWKLEWADDRSNGGDRRSRSFEPAKIAFSSLLGCNSFLPSYQVLLRLYIPERKRVYTQKDICQAYQGFISDGASGYVSRVQSTVLREFQSNFPATLINYYAIYIASRDILQGVHSASHPRDIREYGHICFCPSENLFSQADWMIKENRKGRSTPFPKQKILSALKRNILAVLKDRPLSDFLWKI
ncbi:MAG: hypothetical protein M1834_002128 [Cirrosporium novae-zelandiae]|nr:MAG: hypothetical protein M1834_002128 [Cirrosporium novae-zelandiae]